ncbi:hypothetical protein DL93DRAFT_2165196 [Clavulina sp. PMI_390]|nr:hypothetical protein DL93DRAFT_2165196 [Clavulina sp. PMI_390]
MSSSSARPMPAPVPAAVVADRPGLKSALPDFTITPATPPTAGFLPRFPADTVEGSEKYQERGPSPFSRTRTEAERTSLEIASLKQLEVERIGVTDDENPEALVKILNTDEVLRNHLNRLKTKRNKLEWRALALEPGFFKLNPLVVERLLDIQKDSASAVGALAVVGATLAISLMYSASRGNMWYFFVSWWMFVVSMATTSGLSLAGAGSSISGASDLLETDTYVDEAGGSEGISRATPKNWLKQKISVIAVAFSLIGVAAGWALLAAGAAGYNLYNEITEQNSPKIEAGPNLGPGGIRLPERIITYVIIGIFVIVLIGGYFYRLRPRMNTRYLAASFAAEGKA